jgi:hypothetical protein
MPDEQAQPHSVGFCARQLQATVGPFQCERKIAAAPPALGSNAVRLGRARIARAIKVARPKVGPGVAQPVGGAPMQPARRLAQQRSVSRLLDQRVHEHDHVGIPRE